MRKCIYHQNLCYFCTFLQSYCTYEGKYFSSINGGFLHVSNKKNCKFWNMAFSRAFFICIARHLCNLQVLPQFRKWKRLLNDCQFKSCIDVSMGLVMLNCSWAW
ncbi:hypothetical protein VNO78_32219 [Psophocarpus tetragonolobus]|uniref:Uncharacterized protein n=1 Tax=Psophocarpus tetragonolobus TaxID=3891 RepID=A0AAN9NVI4_PSOTE